MGVIDKVTDTVTALLPWKSDRREQHEVPPVGAEVLALRDDLDRWLNRFFEEPWGLPASANFRWTPALNVQETDKELIVTTEMPGIDQADIRLTATPGQLVISGEKREEHDQTQQGIPCLRAPLRQLRADDSAAAGLRRRQSRSTGQKRSADGADPESGRTRRGAASAD